MADALTAIAVDWELPIYTRLNGKEIELGTVPASVALKVEIGVGAHDEHAEEPAVKPLSWYRIMSAPFAEKHFNFPPFAIYDFVAPDGGKWAWDESMRQWELREYPRA